MVRGSSGRYIGAQPSVTRPQAPDDSIRNFGIPREEGYGADGAVTAEGGYGGLRRDLEFWDDC